MIDMVGPSEQVYMVTGNPLLTISIFYYQIRWELIEPETDTQVTGYPVRALLLL